MIDRLIQNTIVQVLHIVAALLAGVVTSLLVARALEPADYGRYQTALWLLSLVGTLLGFGLGPMLRRFIAEHAGRGEYGAARQLIRLASGAQLAVVLVAVVGLALYSWLAGGAAADPGPPIAAFLIVALGPTLIGALLVSSLAGLQRFGDLAIVGLAQASATLALTGAAALLRPEIESFLAVFVLVQASACAIAAALLRRALARSPGSAGGSPRRRAIGRYMLPVYITMLMDVIVWQRSELFFLNLFARPEDVGHYALAFTLAVILAGTIPGALTGVLLPAMAERWGLADLDNARRLYRVATRTIALVTLPICGIGAALAGPAIELLYGGAYAAVPALLPWMLASTAMASLAGPASAALHAAERPDLLARLGVAMAVVNVGLGYLLIAGFGLAGAALTNFAVQTVGGLLALAIAWRVLGCAAPGGQVLRAALAALAAAAVGSAVVRLDAGLAGLLLAAGAGGAAYLAAARALGAIGAGELAGLWAWLAARMRSLATGLRLLPIDKTSIR